MNTPSAQCLVRLVRIDGVLWDAPAAGGGLTLAQLAGAIAVLGRKMAKGLALREARADLLVLSRQVRQWVAGAPQVAAVDVVPAPLQREWEMLLAALAARRAATAAHELQRAHVMPFLPAVFAPSGAKYASAGAYGSIDVASHVSDLERLMAETDSLSAEGKQVRSLRLKSLRAAAEVKAGVVEDVTFQVVSGQDLNP